MTKMITYIPNIEQSNTYDSINKLNDITGQKKR